MRIIPYTDTDWTLPWILVFPIGARGPRRTRAQESWNMQVR